MTRERDIERVLEAWLADGASEMPDRLFDAVIDRIDHIHQRRRLARFRRSNRALGSRSGIALAIAAAVVLAVVGFAVLGRLSSSSVASPPSPSASPAMSPAEPGSSPLDQTGCNHLFTLVYSDVDCGRDLTVGRQASSSFVHPFAYTVPAGWAASWDTPKGYSLERQSDYIGEGEFRSANVGPTVYVFPDPEAAVQDGSCDVTTQPGIGSSTGALADWVANRPGILASKPVDIAIGGLTGRMVDVQEASTFARLCSPLDGWGDRQSMAIRYIALIRGAGPGGSVQRPMGVGCRRPQRQRYIFLDLGSGKTVAIVLDATSKAFDKLVADAMPIVRSMTFEP